MHRASLNVIIEEMRALSSHKFISILDVLFVLIYTQAQVLSTSSGNSPMYNSNDDTSMIFIITLVNVVPHQGDLQFRFSEASNISGVTL